MKPIALLLLWLTSFTVAAQPAEVVTYKQLDSSALQLEILFPPEGDPATLRPAIVFFFGGGWNQGTREQFRPQAEHFNELGFVCFLADYRTRKGHGTDPFTAVMDAKSAMRYVRANAERWRVDTSRIVAAGGSAGGHLAAATALINDYNDPADDLSVSSQPAALLLFNPVVDNGPAGYGYERIGEAYSRFSPLHNIDADTPPTLFLLGTEDHLIPVVTAEYFCMAVERVGGRCELDLYPGGRHGFFNVNHTENFRATLETSDRFLREIGLIGGAD
ncbi:acetyl esterase/lipase [Lewinella marina]|uniref:Peptidase S9 n=1 Tax=Neolewinella marina TaxID=438751 RepID=A0A2G0CG46_9BACT|nr:alpha/beta hydrolase [Neolewinella marina]NJB86607.1 acetyl esterase/lipase [Neolewinella marina]PHK98942.1 peptidase S9 [Neolewinella marina]